MSRLIPLLPLLVALAGCATTSGTVYHYEGGADYYSATDSPGPTTGYSGGAGYGFAHGYGYGGGFGYGLGHGYGFGFGYGAVGYPGWWMPWYFGYAPYVWWPQPSDHSSGSWRESQVQHDRALRSSLVARPLIAAPLRAKPGRLQPLWRPAASPTRLRSEAPRSSVIRPAVVRPAPPMRTSAPPVMRAAPPPPRNAIRKH
jgi:hypothetical protein